MFPTDLDIMIAQLTTYLYHDLPTGADPLYVSELQGELYKLRELRAALQEV